MRQRKFKMYKGAGHSHFFGYQLCSPSPSREKSVSVLEINLALYTPLGISPVTRGINKRFLLMQCLEDDELTSM